MVILRELISIVLFSLAVVATIDVVVNELTLGMIFLACVLFYAAYLIWPSKRRGNRNGDNWILETVLEIVVEFPIEVVKFLLRCVGRMFGKSDGGIDIDL